MPNRKRRLRLTVYVCLLFAILATQLQQRSFAADDAVLKAQAARVAVIEQAAKSVVAVFGASGGGGGSGVLISADGYALTNFHVTAGAGNFMKCGLNDGKLYDAVIVGIDPTGDVAIIKLLGRDDFPTAPLGDSDKLRVGNWVYAMGNPFLLANDFKPTVTYGIVSGVHRYQYPAGTFLEYTDCIQVDASINPGNSGGPLFNSAGEVVGINGRISFEKRSRVNSGVGYAISINQIKHFMDHLKSGRVVDHATAGATVTTLTDGTVVINEIMEESAAYRRGLRSEDELVSFAGRPIRSVNQFKNILGIYPKGWNIPLVYRRDDQKHEIYFRLRALHRASELIPKPKKRGPHPQPKPKKNDPEKGDPKKPSPDNTPKKITVPKSVTPEKYQKLFVKKEGFANYYFNQLHQNRLVDSLNQWGNFSSLLGTWTFSGKTAANEPFEFIVSAKGLGLNLGDNPFFQSLDDAAYLDEPPETGGLLISMLQFKRLLTQKQKGFTEFFYLGSEPFDGKGEKVDVLVSELTGMKTHWYFSKNDATLLGFDLWMAENDDPCEIRLLSVGEFEGRRFPTAFVVRHGGKVYRTFQIEKVEMKPGTVQTKKEPT